MKKSVYILGIVCANLMMFGSMFKVMHWPGASVMLCCAVFLFCFLFLPMALMNAYNSQEQKGSKTLYIVTFLVFGISIMGTLFKIMHWPGAGMFLILGIPLPFIVFLPVYLYQTRKENKSVNYLGIMFGMTFLAVFSVLLTLNVSRNILNNAATSLIANDNFTLFNQSKLNGIDNENAVKKQADELCGYIDNLKCELLAATGEEVCVNNKIRADFNVMQIEGKDNRDMPNYILFGDESGNKISTLKTKINSFRESLLASAKISTELGDLAKKLFDVSDKESNNPNEPDIMTWEQIQFAGHQLILVLDALSQIQSNVRLAEAELLAIK